MRIGKNPVPFESELYLNDDEVQELKEMVIGASLPLRRTFHKVLTEL